MTFISWNVHGIRSQAKKIKVLDHVTRLKADIVLLQETHLLQTEDKSLLTPNFHQIFSSCHNSRQRGVSILIHKRLDFSLKNVIKDAEGRYVIVQATIFNKLYTITNLYAPNIDEPTFFHTIFSQISDLSADSITLIGGDFNTVLNPLLDRSGITKKVPDSNSAKVIQEYMEDFGLSDGWRLKNPHKRDYTFLSGVHKSLSRIDFFLINNSIISKISTKIHPIIISDHAPVSINLPIDPQYKPTSTWRFNLSLLKDPEFDRMIGREWADFLKINDSPDISPSLLWETGKAVMRGKIISYSSYKKKQEQQNIIDLENNIKKLTDEYANDPQNDLWIKLQNEKIKLDGILSKKTEFILQQLRYKNFDFNNKSGKFLASQLQRNKDKSRITAIQDQSGIYTQSPQDINQIFYHFYKTLYSKTGNSKLEDIQTFLSDLNLPQLTVEYRDILDAPLTVDELQRASDSMSAGKAPGPDGFPIEYIQHFWSILSPLFFRTVTEIKNSGHVRPDMNTASIKLLLKPDKDPTLPTSYRPLSLINTDIKIIAKALASRLETVLPSIIHYDQTGFIKGRHSNNNVRRLLNLISLTQRNNKKAVVISLDAEKAFDKVNWSFLFAALNNFGFGQSFVQWISALYNSPKATVSTNGIKSQSFTLQRGTRQGCPLSPLLFAIFIEPLAIAIRQNVKIKGIKSTLSEHKINLYADDILLYLEEPKTSVQEIFKLLTNFSSLSDYSINWSKSVLLPITENAWNPAAQAFFSTGNIKYLGIHISPKLPELIQLNFTPLLDKICNDLNRWNNLPLTLLGRIATVKMKILPQINYLFSMIPSKPTAKWFQTLDSAIIKFYAKNKKPRISLATLQKSKLEGGLDAPNFMYYYLANQLQFVNKWMNPTEEARSWLELEQIDCNKIQLADLPSITTTIKHHRCFKNPLIASTLSAWWKSLETTSSTLEPCALSPIWHNPDFVNNKTTLHFKTWEQKGITHLHHIFQDNTLMTDTKLFQTFEMGKNNFLQYLQLKNSIKKRIPIQENTLKPPDLFTHVKKITPKNKKNLSKIYKFLINTNSIHLPISKWEEDLGLSSDMGFWTKICENTFNMTKNTNLQLIQFKILHRTHITQYKMKKMGFCQTDICTQCNQNTIDTYLHALWLCSPVQSFWSVVIQQLSSILNCRIPLSPNLCLIGDLTTIDLALNRSQPLLVALAIAKKTILLNWKTKQSLNINQWRNLLIEYIFLEKIAATKREQLTDFTEKWSPFLRVPEYL